VHVDKVEVFIRESFRDMIVRLSKTDGWTPGADLNAEVTNVYRYVHKWHKELADPAFGGDKKLRGVRLIESDKRGNWRLGVKKIEWECEFGRVPV